MNWKLFAENDYGIPRGESEEAGGGCLSVLFKAFGVFMAVCLALWAISTTLSWVFG